MRIDWFTFFAQIVNFLILVFLLKRFLYGPVLGAMQAREKRIADRLADAQRKEEEARREAQAYRERQKELDGQRAALLEKAQKDADRRRRELFAGAQKDAAEARSHWFLSVTRERERLMRELRVRAGQEVFSASRKVLKDLSGADLEGRTVTVFLDALNGPEGSRLKGLRNGGGLVVVRSSFEMPLDTQKKIIGELRRFMNVDNGVQFEVSPDLICGIEVKAGGRKVSWNFSAYLQDLEEKVSSALQREVAAAADRAEGEGVHARV